MNQLIEDARRAALQGPQPNASDAIVAIVCLMVAAFGAGYWTHDWVEDPKTQPVPTVVYRAPLTQWQCTKREFAEHRQACRDRLISEITKPRQSM
jgi:hypothetical protein